MRTESAGRERMLYREAVHSAVAVFEGMQKNEPITSDCCRDYRVNVSGFKPDGNLPSIRPLIRPSLRVLAE